MSLRSELKVVSSYASSSGVGTAGEVTDEFTGINDRFDLVTGTGAGQAEIAWSHKQEGDGGSSTTLDLTDLLGPGGGSISLEGGVKKFIFINDSPDKPCTINGSSADPWTGAFAAGTVVPPGGLLIFFSPELPYSVGGASGTELEIDYDDGDMQFRLEMAGLLPSE